MLKVLLFTLVAASSAAPVPESLPEVYRSRDEHGNSIEYIPIVAETRSEPEDGVYSFTYESADGTLRSESGSPGVNGGTIMEGSWTLVFPDGQRGTISYVAGHNGAVFESPSLLPLAPEMPAHAVEQVKFAAEERAAGIIHDGQWDASKWGSHLY